MSSTLGASTNIRGWWARQLRGRGITKSEKRIPKINRIKNTFTAGKYQNGRQFLLSASLHLLDSRGFCYSIIRYPLHQIVLFHTKKVCLLNSFNQKILNFESIFKTQRLTHKNWTKLNKSKRTTFLIIYWKNCTDAKEQITQKIKSELLEKLKDRVRLNCYEPTKTETTGINSAERNQKYITVNIRESSECNGLGNQVLHIF